MLSRVIHINIESLTFTYFLFIYCQSLCKLAQASGEAMEPEKIQEEIRKLNVLYTGSQG